MKDKKVILINGTKSNWYEQVIFILKQDDESKIPVNLVKEAEKIISEYMSLKHSDKNKLISKYKIENNVNKNILNNSKLKIKNFSNKLIKHILNICIFFCIMLIGILLYKIGF